MLPAQLPERLLEEREQAHRRLGNDRRRPSAGQEEADLTEKPALPERRLYRPVLLDPSYALQDREQLVGVVALACDPSTLRDAGLVDCLGHVGPHSRRELSQARDRP